MGWTCPECHSLNSDSLARCICGFDQYTSDVPVATYPAEKRPWYLSPTFRLITFLFLTPIWAVTVILDKQETRFSRIAASIIFVGYIAFLFTVVHDHLASTSNQTTHTIHSTAVNTADAATSQSDNFNTSEKLVALNGNLLVAIKHIRGATPNIIWKEGQKIGLEQLTKDPYSSLGKIYLLSGDVSQIERLPPNKDLPGAWFDILVTGPNRNSPFGFSNIEIIYNGDAADINPNSKITFAGYFTGTVESTNAMGGDVESLVFISNAIKSSGSSTE